MTPFMYGMPMTAYKSDFLRTLDERGFIHQMTDAAALDKAALAGPVAAYIGFDCTAPSLHVGSLVQIMMLHWLQKTGHQPIVLMGGGTSKVGDPSGKDDSRQLLSNETINGHMATIKTAFDRLLDFNTDSAIMANNADWLDQLQYVPFLRDVGKHFSVNRMLGFDSVKQRLDREQPLSFLEFNYMILQAYDFLELNRRYGCTLQMGGSDQWGNIVNGVDLTRRMDSKDVFGLTTPLLTTSDGKKMGKTADGAVWLNEAQLSSYDYWQYWRNTDDADVVRFLKLFTDLPMAEIAKLAGLQGAEINEAKKILATEATRMVRGAEAANAAAETARLTFEAGGTGGALPTLNVKGSISLVDALVGFGFASSKSDARRLITGGGARLDDMAIKDVTHVIEVAKGARHKLSAGKKNHGEVRG